MQSSRVNVRVSDDGMSVVADVTAGAPSESSSLHEALAKKGVTAGIDERFLRRRIRRQRFSLSIGHYENPKLMVLARVTPRLARPVTF